MTNSDERIKMIAVMASDTSSGLVALLHNDVIVVYAPTSPDNEYAWTRIPDIPEDLRHATDAST